MKIRREVFKPLLLGYLVFALVIGAGFYRVESLADRLEAEGIERSYNICIAQNNMKQVIQGILLLLARPQADDLPGDQDHRERLLEEIAPLLEEEDCPPPPS